MGETDISWTHRPGTVGRSWNPGQGCSRKSEGCRNCYAEKMAARFAEKGWSQGLINLRTRRWNGTVRLAKHKLAEPLGWRKPATVFVNSMTDMFHENYSNEEIAAVFGIMAATPQHVYQMLTKRAQRMREWFEWVAAQHIGDQLMRGAAVCTEHAATILRDESEELQVFSQASWLAHPMPWPLSNVWIGVSVEDQAAADERIPELVRTPAAIRFLSCEPLLGHLAIAKWMRKNSQAPDVWTPPLDWVIAGCESGHGARACSIDWLRKIRDQCARADVAFFLKQAVDSSNNADDRVAISIGDGSRQKGGNLIELPYLDGKSHNAFPVAA